jgi:hypothetical protein
MDEEVGGEYGNDKQWTEKEGEISLVLSAVDNGESGGGGGKKTCFEYVSEGESITDSDNVN